MFIKFIFSKKTIKIDDLTLCSKRQIDGEDLFNFLGLLRKHELYQTVYSMYLVYICGFGGNQSLIFCVVNFNEGFDLISK